jgi:signal transduction histidine kinase
MGPQIAREVAKSHHGRIDVSSTQKPGTSFIIVLPRELVSSSAQPILDAQHIDTM